MDNDYGFCQWIRPYIVQLLKGSTDLCVGGLKVEETISSAAATADEYGINENDIFIIAVPIAGDVVRWQFIFDGSNPDVPPDIILPEFDDFDPEYDEITSLSQWNKNDEESLLTAVKQVVSLHQKHQRWKCCSVGDKFKEELEELSEHKENYNLEVSFKKNERTSNQRVINVLVQLPADFSAIVDKDTPLDPVIRSPLLLIKFEIDVARVTPSIFLPSHVEHVLAAPPYPAGVSLTNYVVKTHERLKESVKLMTESRAKRLEYIAAFLRMFASHVVEYDAEKFLKISLLFSFETFYFLIHVNLSKIFPSEQPILTFQSAYHLNRKNQLYQSVCANYPYSPRWTGSEMAKRTRAFIGDRIAQFKSNCIANGILQ